MRIFLAILTACAAFAVPLVCLLPFEDILTLNEYGALDPAYIAVVLLTTLGFCTIFWALIAGGILVAPKMGLRSHVIDRIRGDAPPAPGGWIQAALIGLAACLPAAFAAAAIRTSSPASFMDETCWRDFAMKDALEMAATNFASGIAGWLGLLNLLVWSLLKAFGAGRRMLALAVAIILGELFSFGLLAVLTVLLDEPLSLAVFAEAAAWSLLFMTGAWLYVTRTLEHGLLALMWAPVVGMAFRPLWAHLGI